MASQKQEAGAGATAIQSHGNTTITIHRGIGPDEMATIMSALAAQLPTYVALARQIVDKRLQEFQDKVLERIAGSPTANRDAFADPDFQ